MESRPPPTICPTMSAWCRRRAPSASCCATSRRPSSRPSWRRLPDTFWPAPARDALDFDSFFTHILAHELSHGIGPQQITLNGRQTTPRKELKELYSTIEEAKADATGLYMLQYLNDHNYLKIDGAPAVHHLSGVVIPHFAIRL